MRDESLIELVGLWLTVSIDCMLVFAVAWVLARTVARHRPAWQSFIWMAGLASFPCLLVLEWTGSGPDRSLVALLERVPAYWLAGSALCYMIVVALLFGLVVHSGVRLHLLCKYSTPLDISFESDETTHDQPGPPAEDREVVLQGAALYVCGQIAAPTSFGILRPLVLLPEPPVGTIYRRFVRAAVVHELIKVLRFDALWTLIARLTQCLFFAHPLVWPAFKRYCLAREQVCDRWTVRATGNVSEYETHLLAIANAPCRTSTLMSIDTPMNFTGPAGLRKRITDLQNYEKPESLRPWPTIVATVLWMLLLAVVAAVSFEPNQTGLGLAVEVWPVFMGAAGAFSAGGVLTIILAISRLRHARLAPPVDGLTGCSRQTVAECVDWLNREWQDLRTALSLTARRLEPLLLVLVVMAATVSFWWVAGPMAEDQPSPPVWEAKHP